MKPKPASARWRRVICALLLLLALGGGLGSVFQALLAPSRAEDEDEAAGTVNAPARVTVKNGIAILTLSAADQQNAGIATARPSPPPAQEAVVGYGAVLDAAPLTDLSNRYLDAMAQVRAADAKLAVSRAALERAKILFKDQQNVSAAQLQGAQGSYVVDQAGRAAAQAKLTMVEVSAQQAWGNVLGQGLIDQVPLITRLIERRDYLIRVMLPPGMTVATPPDTATASLSDRTEVQLSFVSPATATDPKLQGISYFYSAPARQGILPGMTLPVLLPTRPAEGAAVVPDSAVVWLQGKAWVYINTEPNTFVRRAITPYRSAPDGGYIVTGLPSDSEIAVQGVQMLLSEEFRAQVRGFQD